MRVMYQQTMKYLSLIFSIYILYLVSVPCVDDPLHICSKISEQTSDQAPISHPDHADACSPFCVCSCCNVMVTISPVTIINQPYFSFQRSLVPESSTFISSFSLTFWQPPKLS
jgi:hypothetical protein